ncbi:RraA family protein [Streptococcus panodentis]|uniref:Putative 4-hydroxy-4-methyl-2-oxoglutarate aldolase n=1 Tax=Streptococcus panodentis TaxID=1581472 RepID=A0ABS5AYW7_9STRE|nr:hypothetical protein [Streptococcus panodentis]MBP2621438.1 hypothetical protein [Streptococcus panodentis]
MSFLLIFCCKVKGVAGVVIDGSCRDSQDIYDLAYPVFARGYNPAPTIKESLAKTKLPVTVGGVTIHQGDLVIGDCDGVVVIPQADEEQVLARAFQKFEKEKEILAAIQSGQTTVDIYGFHDLIKAKQNR